MDTVHDDAITDEERLQAAIKEIGEAERFREVLAAIDSLIAAQPGCFDHEGAPAAPFPPVLTEDDGDSLDWQIGPLLAALRRWILAGAELCDPPLAEAGDAAGRAWRREHPGEQLRVGPVVSAWLAQPGTDDDDVARVRDAVDSPDFRTFAYSFAYAAGGPMSLAAGVFLRVTT